MKLSLPWRRQKSKPNTPEPYENSSNSLEEAGQILKLEREKRGLSMRDLSTEVRITTPVLEALERGWPERLPEPAYLVAMLQRLETYFNLPSNSLSAALPSRSEASAFSTQGRRTRFTLGSIDIFTTWQGSLVYGAVMLGTILALNHQYHRLVSSAAFSPSPIPIHTPLESDPILKGLRPLEKVLNIPAGELKNPITIPTPSGVLEIKLNQPRLINLSSESGDQTNLQGSTGTVTLLLVPPLNLQIQPPPSETDSVRWNGRDLAAKTNQPGVFDIPQAAALSP